MNKKIIICIISIFVIIGLITLTFQNEFKSKNNIEIKNTASSQSTNTEINKNDIVQSEKSITQEQMSKNKRENIDMIIIKVNNNILEVKLENNKTTKSLLEKLQDGDVSVNASEYGGFEKVGNLGFSLPREDTNITTSAGDIVLYQGNQISLFYESNSWNYTKIGKIQNVSSKELKDILGTGDVILTLTLPK